MKNAHDVHYYQLVFWVCFGNLIIMRLLTKNVVLLKKRPDEFSHVFTHVHGIVGKLRAMFIIARLCTI